MLQAWCYELQHRRMALMEFVDRRRTLLHYNLTKQLKEKCQRCHETCTTYQVKCFIDWCQYDHCVQCTRAFEYDMIDNGSASEGEIDNMYSFNQRALP
jgi:hypothetical protein